MICTCLPRCYVGNTYNCTPKPQFSSCHLVAGELKSLPLICWSCCLCLYEVLLGLVRPLILGTNLQFSSSFQSSQLLVVLVTMKWLGQAGLGFVHLAGDIVRQELLLGMGRISWLLSLQILVEIGGFIWVVATNWVSRPTWYKYYISILGGRWSLHVLILLTQLGMGGQ